MDNMDHIILVELSTSTVQPASPSTSGKKRQNDTRSVFENFVGEVKVFKCCEMVVLGNFDISWMTALLSLMDMARSGSVGCMEKLYWLDTVKVEKSLFVSCVNSLLPLHSNDLLWNFWVERSWVWKCRLQTAETVLFDIINKFRYVRWCVRYRVCYESTTTRCSPTEHTDDALRYFLNKINIACFSVNQMTDNKVMNKRRRCLCALSCADCGPVMCRMWCEYGFAKDALTGCPVCRCADPCQVRMK